LFNNELITSNEYQITSFGDVHSLHIANVADKDAGRFSVIAENVAGKAWCSALLVVVEASQLMMDDEEPPETPLVAATAPQTMMARPIPPRFSEPLKNFTVEEGSPISLECRVAGEPEPLIRWYKEGRPLTHGPGFDIRKNGDRASLTMYSVSEKDSGRYTCIAQNPAGENSSSSTLIVNGT
jgi:Immunoglobulin I-set domain